MRGSLFILNIIWVVTSSLPARADVPPPPDYVENCTIDKTCPYGEECVICDAGYQDYSRSTPICEETYGPLGYTKACQSWGASVWKEIWCRPKSDSAIHQSTHPGVDADTKSTSSDAGRIVTPITCPDEESKPDGGSESESSCSVGVALSGKGDAKADELCLIVFAMVFIIVFGRRTRRACRK